MAVGPASIARPAPLAGRTMSRRSWLEREAVFSWLMLTPGGLFLSLQERRVAASGTFVGLANFVALSHDAVFWQVTRNTFIYTFVTTVLKMVGGLAMALVINQQF